MRFICNEEYRIIRRKNEGWNEEVLIFFNFDSVKWLSIITMSHKFVNWYIFLQRKKYLVKFDLFLVFDTKDDFFWFVIESVLE